MKTKRFESQKDTYLEDKSNGIGSVLDKKNFIDITKIQLYSNSEVSDILRLIQLVKSGDKDINQSELEGMLDKFDKINLVVAMSNYMLRQRQAMKDFKKRKEEE